MNTAGRFSSPLASFFIAVGLFFILFLLYLIGVEMYKVHSFEQIVAEEQTELDRQKSQNIVLEEEGIIRSTAEYLDRFAKENNDQTRPGEVVVIVPEKPVHSPEAIATDISPQSLVRHQSVREQWKSVFFGKK